MSYSGPLIFLYDGLSERHQYPPGLIWALNVTTWHRTSLSQLPGVTDRLLSPLPVSLSSCDPCHRQPITGSASAREQCFYPITVNTATVWEKWSWQAATVLIHFNETSCRWTTLNLFSAATNCQHTALELAVRTFSHFCWNFQKQLRRKQGTDNEEATVSNTSQSISPLYQVWTNRNTFPSQFHTYWTVKVRHPRVWEAGSRFLASLNDSSLIRINRKV